MPVSAEPKPTEQPVLPSEIQQTPIALVAENIPQAAIATPVANAVVPSAPVPVACPAYPPTFQLDAASLANRIVYFTPKLAQEKNKRGLPKGFKFVPVSGYTGFSSIGASAFHHSDLNRPRRAPKPHSAGVYADELAALQTIPNRHDALSTPAKSKKKCRTNPLTSECLAILSPRSC